MCRGERSGKKPIMGNQWQYQIRIQLCDAVAEAARRDPNDPAIKPLTDILTSHHASMQCQFDAFADYAAEAERHGTENYSLYKWTKATIENPDKKEKYLQSFTLYVEGNEVEKQIAEALESDLHPLLGGDLIKRISKYDTNPANSPHPPEHFRR